MLPLSRNRLSHLLVKTTMGLQRPAIRNVAYPYRGNRPVKADTMIPIIPARLVDIEPPDPDLVVGEWPRTKEERERAARKYNLIPEDYEPYDEGEAFGDYPKLPEVGAFNRDWYDDFDDPWDMRFYNEPLHLNYDLYLWERIDPWDHLKPHWVPWYKKLFIFCCTAAFVPVFAFCMENFRIHFNHPWKVRPVGYNYDIYDWPTPNPKYPHH